MNFRTLIMLAVAALVIVIAIKMNQDSVAVAEPLPAQAAPTIMEEKAANEGTVMTEEEMQELIHDDMDGTIEVPETAPAEKISDEPITPDAEAPAAQ